VPDAGETVVTGTVDSGSNNPPVLDPIGDQSVLEGETKTVTITATDPDAGSSLSFSASNLPSFTSFVDNGDGTATLTISPDYGDAGTYNGIFIAVSDGTDSDSEGLIIVVNVSSQQVIVVQSSSADGMVYDPLVSTINNPYTNDVSYGTGSGMKLGHSDNGGGLALISDILVFELPELPVGKIVTGGEISVYINWKREWVSGSFDLYGLPYSSNDIISSDMHYAGAFISTQNGNFGLQDGFWTAPAGGDIETPGYVSSSSDASGLIAGYINTQYDNGAKAGDFVFIRLSPAEDYVENGNFVFVTSGNSGDGALKPKLKLSLGEATAIPKQQTDNSITLYPNPSSNGAFTINFDNFAGDVTVSVMNIQGSVVYSKTVPASQQKCSVIANLPAGTYIVTLNDDSKLVTKKLIVK
jgi:hypothetical protein